ncbi:MAG: copper transporter [Desulfocucumaceae bacterium]
MFINIKYHIASLVAIFLSLSLGILVGSALSWDDTLAKQQIAARLESQVDVIKQNNDSLRVRLMNLEMNSNIQKQFERKILPVLVHGKLEGRKVAIIDINGFSYPEDLVNTLYMSGASINSVTFLGGLNLKDKGQLLLNIGWPSMDEKKMTEKICQELSRAIITGDTIVIDALEKSGSIKKTGQYGQKLSDLVLIGGSHDRNNVKTSFLDFRIIESLKAENVAVYGVEDSMVQYSYIADYHKKRITTVDNIDTLPGQVSLVYAMAGSPGQYGIKATAKKLMPDLEYGADINAR